MSAELSARSERSSEADDEMSQGSADSEDEGIKGNLFSLTLNKRITKRFEVWEKKIEESRRHADWSEDVRKMEEASRGEGIASHVSEIYSRPT